MEDIEGNFKDSDGNVLQKGKKYRITFDSTFKFVLEDLKNNTVGTFKGYETGTYTDAPKAVFLFEDKNEISYNPDTTFTLETEGGRKRKTRKTRRKRRTRRFA